MQLRDDLMMIIEMIDSDVENTKDTEELIARLKGEEDRQHNKGNHAWLSTLSAAKAQLYALDEVLLSITQCAQISIIAAQAIKRAERNKRKIKELKDKFKHVK